MYVPAANLIAELPGGDLNRSVDYTDLGPVVATDANGARSLLRCV